MRRGSGGLMTVLVLLLVLGGCGRSSEPSAAHPAQEVESSDGPLRVRASVDESVIDTVASAHLRIETFLRPGNVLIEPRIGEKLGDFRVESIARSGPVLTEDGDLWVDRRLVLEPYLDGSYEIPRLSFAYRSLEGEREGTVDSGRMVVRVESVLDSEGFDLGQPGDVLDAPEPPPSPVLPWIVAGSVGGLALALVGALVVMKRRAETPESPIPALRRRLDRLAESQDFDATGLLVEVQEILGSAIAATVERHAASMSSRDLIGASKGWPGWQADDLSRFRELVDALDEALYARSPVELDRARTLAREASRVAEALHVAGNAIRMSEGAA
ncbi:MAG: hypothetical protein H6811_10045 [Phycisphaeraceae bacterium]|nr:hypothetical protein [Phycisphaeraceae bacterium]